MAKPKTQVNASKIKSSLQLSLMCAIVVAILMAVLRPLFSKRAEATFLGGILGAILYFFLLICYGNYRMIKNRSSPLNWLHIAAIELVALVYSYLIHPVCTTTCLLFSIPVIVYLKWANFELSEKQN